MMLGEYPCCNGALAIKLPDADLPKFAKEDCPHCGRLVWHQFSRVNPKSWTAKGFLEAYDVDDEAMTIKPKTKAA